MQQIPDEVLLGAYSGLGDGEAADDAERPGSPGYRARSRAEERRVPRHFYPPNKEHMWERVADELYVYIDEMPDQLAEALMPEGRAPFTASPPHDEQLAFWLTRLYLPDGTVNLPAVEEVLATASPDEIRSLATAIREARGGEAA
jgi:hypothetical protein